MTPEQKRQATSNLVKFVSDVTYSPRDMTKAEAMVLPAVLGFLMKTNSSEGLCITFPETEINSAVLPDLYKMVKKFAKSKE